MRIQPPVRTALLSLGGLLLVLVVAVVGFKVVEALVKRTVRAALPDVERAEPVKPETVYVPVDSFVGRWQEEQQRTERIADRTRGRGTLPQRIVTVLAGWQERPPTIVTITDSAVNEVPPPQVIVDGRGRLSIGGVWEDSAGVQRGISAEGIRTADCDDGWRMSGTTLVCNRARLGHLSAFGGAGASLPFASVPLLQSGTRPPLTLSCEAGLRWEPSYRSPHAVEVRGGCDRTVEVGARVGVRIF